jgi:hypothetical protein
VNKFPISIASYPRSTFNFISNAVKTSTHNVSHAWRRINFSAELKYCSFWRLRLEFYSILMHTAIEICQQEGKPWTAIMFVIEGKGLDEVLNIAVVSLSQACLRDVFPMHCYLGHCIDLWHCCSRKPVSLQASCNIPCLWYKHFKIRNYEKDPQHSPQIDTATKMINLNVIKYVAG